MGKRTMKRSLMFALVFVLMLATVYVINGQSSYADEQTVPGQGLDEEFPEEDSGNNGDVGPVYEEDSGNGGDVGPVYEEDSGNGGDVGPILPITEEGIDNVVLISTGQDLYNLAETLNSGLFTQTFGENVSNMKIRLENDIDLSAYRSNGGFMPIGTLEHPFTGEFEGGGHTISNLYINREDKGLQGLFGEIGKGGLVKNLNLANANVKGQTLVGGIAGLADFSTISNCTVSGSIEAAVNGAGGIAGCVAGGIIEECSSAGSVIADENSAGGIAGVLVIEESLIKNCSSSSNISVKFSAGGIVGCLLNGSVEGCTFSGEIDCGSNLFGNMVGEIDIVEVDKDEVDSFLESFVEEDAYNSEASADGAGYSPVKNSSGDANENAGADSGGQDAGDSGQNPPADGGSLDE